MPFPVPTLAFIDGIGGPEMMLILVIVLMLFGGQKLPELARGLGKSMKEFKKAATGVEEEFKRALQEDEQRKNTAPVITSAQPVPALAETSDNSGTPPGEAGTAESIPPSPTETTVVAPVPVSDPIHATPVPPPEPVAASGPAPVAVPPRRGRADV